VQRACLSRNPARSPEHALQASQATAHAQRDHRFIDRRVARRVDFFDGHHHSEENGAGASAVVARIKAGEAWTSADAKPVIVSVATNFPYFFIDNRALTIDQLQKELIAAAQKDPQVKLAIKADKRSPFGEVIKVIDAGKVAQVGSISAITEKPVVR
jgi:hypothetical protein